MGNISILTLVATLSAVVLVVLSLVQKDWAEAVAWAIVCSYQFERLFKQANLEV